MQVFFLFRKRVSVFPFLQKQLTVSNLLSLTGILKSNAAVTMFILVTELTSCLKSYPLIYLVLQKACSHRLYCLPHLPLQALLHLITIIFCTIILLTIFGRPFITFSFFSIEPKMAPIFSLSFYDRLLADIAGKIIFIHRVIKKGNDVNQQCSVSKDFFVNY